MKIAVVLCMYWTYQTCFRHQYNLAKSLPVMDRQLLDICQGLWTKLRYMYERRKVQKTSKRLQKMEEKES